MESLNFTDEQPGLDSSRDELGIPRLVRPEAVSRALELYSGLTQAGVRSFEDSAHPAAGRFYDAMDRLTPEERTEVWEIINTSAKETN